MNAKTWVKSCCRTGYQEVSGITSCKEKGRSQANAQTEHPQLLDKLTVCASWCDAMRSTHHSCSILVGNISPESKHEDNELSTDCRTLSKTMGLDSLKLKWHRRQKRAGGVGGNEGWWQSRIERTKETLWPVGWCFIKRLLDGRGGNMTGWGVKWNLRWIVSYANG